MRYSVARERTMENKPDGQEHSAILWVIDTEARSAGRSWAEFVVASVIVRYKGRQVIDEDIARVRAERIARDLNEND